MEVNNDLIPHLFRSEYPKIVAVLASVFGFKEIEIAEDITGDTFLIAIETWGLKGLPENPTAWLYNVAKNNARNYIKKANLFSGKISPNLERLTENFEEIQIDISQQNISDSQLRVVFAICDPTIPPKAQICLALQILCGFGIEEIADALLSNKETVNKRLFRAKEKLRQKNVKLNFPPDNQIVDRVDTVLTTIYLLFNEGYYSINKNAVLRKDLCLEAMRLCYLLTENKITDLPAVNALLALMCFHASRFDARVSDNGKFIKYDQQEVKLWNTQLIENGENYLTRAATGNTISKYHLEAAIAFWHTKSSNDPAKWRSILGLYDTLLAIDYSPSASLNRIVAFSKIYGNQKAIDLAESETVIKNYYYHVLLGELYSTIEVTKALEHYKKALVLSKTLNDRSVIESKILNLKEENSASPRN